MADMNELKEKAKSRNVLDKLIYIYSLVNNIININNIYTHFKSLQNVHSILKELVYNKDLTRHLGKRNLESYIHCKEQCLYVIEQLNIYEKELQKLNSQKEHDKIDLSYTIILANLTVIVNELKSIIVIIKERTIALLKN